MRRGPIRASFSGAALKAAERGGAAAGDQAHGSAGGAAADLAIGRGPMESGGRGRGPAGGDGWGPAATPRGGGGARRQPRTRRRSRCIVKGGSPAGADPNTLSAGADGAPAPPPASDHYHRMGWWMNRPMTRGGGAIGDVSLLEGPPNSPGNRPGFHHGWRICGPEPQTSGRGRSDDRR